MTTVQQELFNKVLQQVLAGKEVITEEYFLSSSLTDEQLDCLEQAILKWLIDNGADDIEFDVDAVTGTTSGNEVLLTVLRSHNNILNAALIQYLNNLWVIHPS